MSNFTRLIKHFQKNGIAVEEAATVFAREAAARTAPGNYIQNPAGGWVKK